MQDRELPLNRPRQISLVSKIQRKVIQHFAHLGYVLLVQSSLRIHVGAGNEIDEKGANDAKDEKLVSQDLFFTQAVDICSNANNFCFCNLVDGMSQEITHFISLRDDEQVGSYVSRWRMKEKNKRTGIQSYNAEDTKNKLVIFLGAKSRPAFLKQKG